MKLISNSIIYFSGSVASKLLTLVSLPFLTAVLTPKEYGVIAMLFMTGVFASSICSLGLGTSIGEIYYSFNQKNDNKRVSVIPSGLMVIFITHIFYCLFILNAGDYLSFLLFDTSEFSYVLVTMLIGQAIQNIVFPLQLKIQFEERFKVAAVAMILTSTVSVGLMLFLVIVMDRGLKGYGEGVLLGAFFQLLIYIYLSRINFFISNFSIAFQLINKGWAMILSFFFLFVIQYGVRLPIEWFGGLEVLGVYLIGTSLAAPVGMVTAAFVNVWTPYALGFSDRPNEASVPLAAATRAYIIVMGIFVILIFMLAPLIAKILVADEYYQSYYIIGLSALWYYFSSIFLLLLPPVYFACDVARSVVRVQAFTTFVFIAISAPLIMYSPLIGAAFSVALSGLVLVAAQFFWNKKLRALQYIQIHYDKLTISLVVIIPIAGILMLMLDFLWGQFWVSVLAGNAILVILLKLLLDTPQIKLMIDSLRMIFFKAR